MMNKRHIFFVFGILISSLAMFSCDSTLDAPEFAEVTPIVEGVIGAASTIHIRGQSAAIDSQVIIYEGTKCGGRTLGSELATVFLSAAGMPVVVQARTKTSFSARLVDASGNKSNCVAAPFTYTNDPDAPMTPLFSGTDPITGSPSTRPEVLGTAEPKSRVEIFFSIESCESENGSQLAKAHGQADENDGNFRIAVDVQPNSVTSFFARAVDAAGNHSPCTPKPIDFESDNSDIQITSVTPMSPSSDRNPRILGTASPGASIRVFTNSTCTGVQSGEAVANDIMSATPGAFTAPVMVERNTINFLYVVERQLGESNWSRCPAVGIRYEHDDEPPAVPVMSGISPASPSNLNDVMVSGRAERGALVTVFKRTASTLNAIPAGDCVPGTEVGPTTTANDQGIFTTPAHVPDDSVSRFSALAIDAAGNISGCSTINSFYTEDSSTSQIVGIWTTPDSQNPFAPATELHPLVFGHTDAQGPDFENANVQIFVSTNNADRCVPAPGTSVVTGSLTDFMLVGIPITAIENQSTWITARIIDQLGNGLEHCSLPLLYIHDATPPLPLIEGPSLRYNNTNGFQLSGLAPSATSVAIFETTNYPVYCSGDPVAVIPVVVNGAGAFTFSYQVTGVPDNTRVYYRVQSRNAGGYTKCSNTIVTYAEDSTPPQQTVAITNIQPLMNQFPAVNARMTIESSPSGIYYSAEVMASFALLRSQLRPAIGAPCPGGYGFLATPLELPDDGGSHFILRYDEPIATVMPHNNYYSVMLCDGSGNCSCSAPYFW